MVGPFLLRELPFYWKPEIITEEMSITRRLARSQTEYMLTRCSLMRSAYRNVFKEWSVDDAPGEIVEIMLVFESGEKQSFRISAGRADSFRENELKVT